MIQPQARLQAASAAYSDIALSSQVEGASPHQLVEMLFQELVRNLGVMAAAVKARNLASQGSSHSRALSILSWLQSSLDMERGGEVAVTLSTLYADCRRRVMNAARERDVEAILQVRATIADIAEAWTAIGPSFTPPSADPAFASSR